LLTHVVLLTAMLFPYESKDKRRLKRFECVGFTDVERKSCGFNKNHMWCRNRVS